MGAKTGTTHLTRPLVVLVVTVFVVAGHAASPEEPTVIGADRAHALPLSGYYPHSMSILPGTSCLAIATRETGLAVYDTEVAGDQRVTTSALNGAFLPATRDVALNVGSLFNTSLDARGRRRTTPMSATLDPLGGYLNWRKSTHPQSDIRDISLSLRLALERVSYKEPGTLLVRNLATLEVMEEVRLSDRNIRMARLSPDGSLFLSSLDAPDTDPGLGRYGVENQIRVFPTGEVVADLPPFGNPIAEACFSRDGKLLLIATGAGYDFTGMGGGIVEGPDHRVIVFTVPEGKSVFEWTAEERLRFAAFNPDETLILAGCGNRLSILDWKGNRERVRLVVPENEKQFISADITADGKTVYTLQNTHQGEGLLRSWDLGDLLK